MDTKPIIIERGMLNKLVEMVGALAGIARMHADGSPIAKHIDYARLADDALALLDLVNEEALDARSL